MAKTESKSKGDSPARVTMTEIDVNAIAQALAAPFDPAEVKFKPQTVSGNRALAVPFVDARVIQDRLDEVVGVLGWQDNYTPLPDGSVVCRLGIRLGDEWITKEDVGGQSEQPDEGDRRKAAFSDALKRAAVKFGIGRYLYRLKPQWVDFDAQKRQFVTTPRLPASALPAHQPQGNAASVPNAEALRPEPAAAAAPVEKKGAAKSRAPQAGASPAAARGMPTNGLELLRRLTEKDERLAKEGVCKPGDLVKHVQQAGVKAGFEPDLSTWTGPAIHLAIDETRAFESKRRQAAVAA